MIEIGTPVEKEKLLELRVGELVCISGEMFTARDKAHLRAIQYMKEGKKLPVNFNRAVVYHCGPLLMKKTNEWVVVSAGPTTSARMNDLTLKILDRVESIVIVGKGGMSMEITEALKGKGVYLAYTGGAGALAAKSIRRVKACYWEDLGMAEAIWVFEVEKFSCVVGIDSHGRNLYEEVKAKAERNFQKMT